MHWAASSTYTDWKDCVWSTPAREERVPQRMRRDRSVDSTVVPGGTLCAANAKATWPSRAGSARHFLYRLIAPTLVGAHRRMREAVSLFTSSTRV